LRFSILSPNLYALAPDSQALLWSEGNALRTISLADGRVLRRWEIDDRHLRELLFSRDGKTLITLGEGVRVWDFAKGKERHNFEAHRVPVSQAVFADDGRSLVSRDRSGFVRRWEAPSGKSLLLGNGYSDRTARLLSADGGRSL